MDSPPLTEAGAALGEEELQVPEETFLSEGEKVRVR